MIKLYRKGIAVALRIDFSQVEPGDHEIKVVGRTSDGKMKDNDIENITVSVANPW